MTDVASSAKPSRKLEKILGALIGLILAIIIGGYALAYFLSPAVIRHPGHTHFHFRMIVVNAGKPVDFSADAFQTDYAKDVCSAALTKQPIHFHDHADQYGHIHWAGITGGMVFKNYGWNLIGGIPGMLGYRFDEGVLPQPVSIHSNALPKPPADARLYVYTGTASDHKLRNSADFVKQPLADFLKGTPVVDASEDAELEKLDMTRADMNDVMGNMVIFVQKDAPKAADVTAEFSKLKPLPDSPCEG